jgi:hypothetical protein
MSKSRKTPAKPKNSGSNNSNLYLKKKKNLITLKVTQKLLARPRLPIKKLAFGLQQKKKKTQAGI